MATLWGVLEMNKRCECCQEILEHEYCYVCDGDECKQDQIQLDFRGEHLEIAQYISYVEMGEDTWRHLYE